MKCDCCNAQSKGYELFDYCAKCGNNLCDSCMVKGCCGHIPALSGSDEPIKVRPQPTPSTREEGRT